MTLLRAGLLEAIVFVSGGVLLSLEIIGSRVLAPYFGNSVYVWGSLIGVFLAALSVGYAVGGRIADRHPSATVFLGAVFLGGLLIVPIPWIASSVLGTISFIDFGPQFNPLFGAIALFVVPSIVIGAVSPFAVRLRTREVDTVGRTAGSLYAVSTVGSIVGTLLTSFVLVDHLGVHAIIAWGGAVLMVTAVAGWLVSRRVRAASIGAAPTVVFTIVALRSPATANPSTVIYAKDTVYHRITVSDVGRTRYLALDDRVQGGLDRDDVRRAVFPYSDYLHLPIVFVPSPRRVTLIGLGAGTVPARYLADYPNVTMSVAEIDREVVLATERWFGVRAGERLEIVARDGRLHLHDSKEPQDIILTDAYLIDSVPVHLATREFCLLARSRLALGGAVGSNVIGALDGPRSRLFRSIYKTMRDVFRTVYVFASPVAYGAGPGRESERGGEIARETVRNLIVIATDAAALDSEEIHRRAAALVAGGIVTVDGFADAARRLHTGAIRVDDVPILTDDFAPVAR